MNTTKDKVIVPDHLPGTEIIELTSEDLTRMKDRTQFWMSAPIDVVIKPFKACTDSSLQ